MTMLISANSKLTGNCTIGTLVWVTQKVSLHVVQWKCTCRSSGLHSHPSRQSAYFGTPVPSSILCMSLFFSKVFKVRYRVVLSAFSKAFSSSVNPMALVRCMSCCSTSNRMVVGFIFFDNRQFMFCI